MTPGGRPWGEEIKARVRATMAYADMRWPAVAEAFDVSESTVRRKLHQTTRMGTAYRRELANICGVPEWFILEGFSPSSVPQSVQRTVDEMEELRGRDDEEERRRRGA